MPGIKDPLTINGVPVVAAPAGIDLTNSEQLRAVLHRTADRGHAIVVVDMTRTRFCDSAGLSVLIRAHKRALAQGGELRLVIPAGGAVFRVFTLTGLHRLIPLVRQLGPGSGPGTRARDPRTDPARPRRLRLCAAAWLKVARARVLTSRKGEWRGEER